MKSGPSICRPCGVVAKPKPPPPKPAASLDVPPVYTPAATLMNFALSKAAMFKTPTRHEAACPGVFVTVAPALKQPPVRYEEWLGSQSEEAKAKMTVRKAPSVKRPPEELERWYQEHGVQDWRTLTIEDHNRMLRESERTTMIAKLKVKTLCPLCLRRHTRSLTVTLRGILCFTQLKRLWKVTLLCGLLTLVQALTLFRNCKRKG